MESIFARGLTYTKTVTMVTENCCNCGISFGLPSDFRDMLMDGNKQKFYCPNGHPQWYTGESKDVLLRKIEENKLAAQKREEELRNKWLAAESERNNAERKLRRVAKGVCPCCNRTFTNLHKHFKTKHPELAKASPVAKINKRINKK